MSVQEAARPPLHVIGIRSGENYRVRLVGELDLGTVALLESELEHAFETGAASVVIDLTKLDYIDSAGLNFLARTDAKSRVDSNRVTFRGPATEQVGRLLRLTQLDTQFKLT